MNALLQLCKDQDIDDKNLLEASYVVCVQFQVFLLYRANHSIDHQIYYKSCLDITLSRQVGSRYFVTSCNATKILFLAFAAIQFLTFTDKYKDGKKLEKDVFQKLHDSELLTCLQADALMFHHVFADLVTLAKSKELRKSAYDMQQHYLELKFFLESI